MTRPHICAIVALIGLLSVALRAQSPDTSGLVEGRNAFAASLYGALSDEAGNLFLSPYSVATALAMVREGAAGTTASQVDAVLRRQDGATARDVRALVDALRPTHVSDGRERRIPAYELWIANALWGQRDFRFRSRFLKVLEEGYGAPIQRVDFKESEKARVLINSWVEEATHNRIKDIVPTGMPLPDTVSVLANAIYFKAAWDTPFRSEFTREQDFSLAPDKTVRTPFMRGGGYLEYAESKSVRVLEIPYRGGHTSMVIVLPKERGGLAAVEAEFASGRLPAWLKGLRSTRVTVTLPRFRITGSFLLQKALSAMGMPEAFDPSAADFSRVTDEQTPYWIGEVIHKAFVAVDEAGIEAAAATIVMGRAGSLLSRPPISFVADHPFLFLIRHRGTGCILFVGRVSNPLAG